MAEDRAGAVLRRDCSRDRAPTCVTPDSTYKMAFSITHDTGGGGGSILLGSERRSIASGLL